MSESESIGTALVNDLRQFRLNKSICNKREIVPGKKRIQVMDGSDSDTEIGQPQKKIKTMLSVKEKESRFLELAELYRQYDTMDIQDSLARNNWNIALAQLYLTQKCKPKIRITSEELSEKKVTSKSCLSDKTAKCNSKSSNYSDGEESGDDIHQEANQVYDSDDSDNEQSNEMSGQRKKVFDFMNNASLIELQTVKTLSEKKAAFLTEIRPFKSWSDLCSKLLSYKGLSTDLLNYAQELINKQNNVASILEKCNKMVKRLEAAIETGAGITEQPHLLNNKLKLADYQLIGLNWLVVMHNQKMNGILADEMGLGKTIQIIAFIAYLKQHNLTKAAHLIVVPSSTLDNWEAEILKWCPTLIVEKYYGSQDDRRKMRIRYAKNGFTGFDILLTTYHVVGSTPEERKMFRVCKLHYVIFDEAHMLKNMTTQRYTNLITINAEMRILLTGTPLQNNLLELMSLLCFVMPSFFSKSIEDIKSLFAKKSKAEQSNEEASLFQETQVERAKRIMKPFVLRRLKSNVLNNLPKKTTYTHKVPMSESQKFCYNELVEFYSNKKGEICSGDRAGVTIMMDMRKIANHPLLMRYYFTDSKLEQLSTRFAKVPSFKKNNVDYIFEELAVMSDFQVWQLCQKHEFYDIALPSELICNSGKFKHFDTLLPQLKAEGHRVLIFSQFTMMLDIVEQYLTLRKYQYLRLDGSTAVEERQDMIDDFNEDSDIFIFLLSTKAGGVGINLTAADTCIIHDIDFNPYNDRQAEDRCHRIGQTRQVTIYRLISESTIEEGMLLIANEKLKLERDITLSEKGEVQEQKCVLRLLTMALGLDKEEEEQLNNSLNNSIMQS